MNKKELEKDIEKLKEERREIERDIEHFKKWYPKKIKCRIDGIQFDYPHTFEDLLLVGAMTLFYIVTFPLWIWVWLAGKLALLIAKKEKGREVW